MGADLKEIRNAYAFELPPDGPDRLKHVEFNLSLIARSNGLLAQPTGAERYLTVGAGHTVAFCRACIYNCITPEDSLKDENGKVDLQKVCSDKTFKVMVEQGWDWKIIPYVVDKECPKLASAAQIALRASSHVASLIGELETAQMLSEHIDASDNDDYMESALEAVNDVCAPCASYATHIAKFVQYYAGGAGAPHIHFADAVAKEFHVNAALGEGSVGRRWANENARKPSG